MTGRLLRSWVVVAVVMIGPRPAQAESPRSEPGLGRLRADVTTLASPEFEGRRGEGGRKTVEFLVGRFRELGLAPLFEGGFTQDIPAPEPGQIFGRNVGARLVGCDPALRDEWVIVSAHFDHLGVRDGVLYPGADDDASGVAMVLEVARSLAQAADKPRRSVMFLGFDLEEVGLWGSRYFVEHSPVPLDRVALFVTADMIGRSLGGVCDPFVFVIGSEHAPGLRPWIDRASAGKPLSIGLFGTDVVGTRSDYGPFRSRKVPYLFFSTGENPCYHKPTDTADTLDYAKLEAITQLILGVLREACSADSVPGWSDTPSYPFCEAIAVRDILRLLLGHGEELKIGVPQRLLMKNALRNLDAIVARGSITPGERIAMVRVAQIIMVSVL
jgi:hypothetical protein